MATARASCEKCIPNMYGLPSQQSELTILPGVPPGWFEAFGGWTAYTASQFTNNADAGGMAPVDFNVCFDDAATRGSPGVSVVFAQITSWTLAAAPCRRSEQHLC